MILVIAVFGLLLFAVMFLLGPPPPGPDGMRPDGYDFGYTGTPL